MHGYVEALARSGCARVFSILQGATPVKQKNALHLGQTLSNLAQGSALDFVGTSDPISPNLQPQLRIAPNPNSLDVTEPLCNSPTLTTPVPLITETLSGAACKPVSTSS